MLNPIFGSLFIFLFSICAVAAETDGFTSRYDQIEDGLPLITIEINQRVHMAITNLNLEAKMCDYAQLASFLGDQLRRPFRGQIEGFILDNEEVPKSVIPFEESILKNVTTFHHSIIKLGIALGIGYSPPIRHKGFLIGADKFGHFLDEGYYYYKLVHEWDYTVEDALKFGDFLEIYFEGKSTGGIYSYADLSANYEGYLFWLDLLGSVKLKRSSQYFECDQGKWKILKPIDMDKYVSPGMDEGMNCNAYISETMEADINKTILELEKKHQKRFQCPVYPDKIPELRKRYGDYAKYILNPKLL